MEWYRFRNTTLRLSAINLVGDVFVQPPAVQGDKPAAAVRINVAGADLKFLLPQRLGTLHEAMVALTDEVQQLRAALGIDP